MHELGIAGAVLEAVRAQAALRPECRVSRIGLRVGALSGVNPEALSFCIEALVRDTDLADVALEIETPPRTHRCAECETTFEVSHYQFECPECGSFQPACVGGSELELAFLELEES